MPHLVGPTYIFTCGSQHAKLTSKHTLNRYVKATSNTRQYKLQTELYEDEPLHRLVHVELHLSTILYV